MKCGRTVLVISVCLSLAAGTCGAHFTPHFFFLSHTLVSPAVPPGALNASLLSLLCHFFSSIILFIEFFYLFIFFVVILRGW